VPPMFDQRFRAVNDWLVPRGWKAGFPNCHQANYGDDRGTVHGTLLMHATVADWRDVFARDMSNPSGYRLRLTAAHDYAINHGYDHGFPNFHQADYGQGLVYGTFFIKKGFTEWRDVPVTDLGMSGDPTSRPMEEWFWRTHDYAVRNGFAAGMPNGHYAYYGRWVIGVHFFLPGSVEWRDVPGYQLSFEPKPSPWQIVSTNSQVLAIHAALMPTNDILYFGGDEHSQAQHNRNEIDNTRLFNVSSGAIITLTSPTTDVFCSGHAFIADGRLLVAGGTETWSGVAGEHGHGQAGHFTGHRVCWVYDFRNRAWNRVADMRPQAGFEATNEGGGRWYPTLLTLTDGQVLAVSGHPSRTDRRHTNTSPERYSPGTNWWRVITTQEVDSPYYPRLHLLPSGNIFFASPVGGANRIYNPATGEFVGPAIALPGDGLYNGWGATSVLLPLLPSDGYTPHILVCGASQPRRINLGEVSPSWQNAGTRTGAAAGRVRENLCAVILPTGEVFLSGGVSVVNPENPVLEGEIYSPGIDWTTGTYTSTERWTSTEPARVARNYHSVALLMPNGRVWTAGSSKNAASGDPAVVGEMRIEVYKPPYDAELDRPQITSSPSSIVYGQTFEVRTPQAANIRRVALIRAGSVTHAFDSDQRYVGLRFSYAGGDVLRVTAPPNGGIAPSGYYMLWVVDNAGRPCTFAKFVHMSPLGQEIGDLLHLSGVTSDGRLWHTIRFPAGPWQQFGDVEEQTGDRGSIVDVDLQSIDREMHLCAVNSSGRLWHTIRRVDRSWQQFDDVEGQAGDRGAFVKVGVAEVTGTLHVCGVTSGGRLWHTIRRVDGSWQQFGDVERQAGNRGTFTDVDCAGFDGQLHVTGATQDGRLWHTIRRPEGSWQQFGDVEGVVGDRGLIRDVACAGIAGALHVCGVSHDGRLWHTIRRPDGSWVPFGDVEGQAGDRGSFARVSAGECGAELHVSGVTSDGRLWHTIRRVDGSWQLFGDVEGATSDRGSFLTVSVDGLFGPI
jgi:Domain of unknown function (DUF1929)